MSIPLRILCILASFAAFASIATLAGSTENPALKAISEGKRNYTIAIVGDSRAHTGISPTALTAQLATLGLNGATAHNYAVDGTDSLHHFSTVQNGVLKTERPPALVIWAANPLQFDGTRLNNRLEQLLPADLVPLFEAGAPHELLFDVLTMSFFKPWRHRPLVASVVSDYVERAGKRTIPFQTKLLGLTFTPEPLSRKYTPMPDGQSWFEVLDWKDRFDRGAKAYIADYNRLTLSDFHFNLTRLMARRVRAAGGKLLILEMPVAPWFQQNLAVHPKHAEWRKRIQQVATEEGAVFWNHADTFPESDRQFGDPGHMPRETALEYTTRLARILYEDPEIRTSIQSATRTRGI